MKTNQLFLIAILCIINITGFSQINYQAVLRDADNIPISDSGLEIDVTITQEGTTIYSETHSNVSSAPLGILNLAVGAGIPITGVFDEIDWSLSEYEIIVAVDGEVLPSSPIRSVPIAEFAKNSRWKYNSADTTLSYNDGKVEIGDETFTSTQALLVHGRALLRGNAETLTLNSGMEGGHTYMQFFNHGMGSSRSGYFGYPADLNPHLTIRNAEEDGRIHLHPASGITRNTGRFQIIKGASSLALYSPSVGSHTFMEFHKDGLTGDRSGWIGYGSDGTDLLTMRNETGGRIRILTDNTVDVNCLRILGGCDLKEDFNSVETLQAGDIVVWDENNPGQLIRSSTPYDKKVAGVISGANGINPGITLSQDDLESGEHPLAMVGKVYVNAIGKVEVGDFLTTSDIPGKAMVASDYSKITGSVIGKAISKLEGGEGFVLVWVNLQ